MGPLPRSASFAAAATLLLLVAIAGLLSPASAVRYTVGGNNGWRRPTNLNYFAQWAAQYTFTTSDIFLFDNLGANTNFIVVDETDFAACVVTNPLGGKTYLPPVTFNASAADPGTYYFTSAVAGDCAAGLKVALAIQASTGSGGGGGGGSAPPPSPSAVPPAPRGAAPPPAPGTPFGPPPPPAGGGGGGAPPPGPEYNFVYVGGDGRWARPTSLTFYNEWADKNVVYIVSDLLVFLYDNTTHNVVQLESAAYSSCTTSSPVVTFNTGADGLQLPEPGLYYFSSSVGTDCQAGMRFQIRAVAGSRPATPGGGAPPPPAPATGSTPPPTPQLLPPPLARPPLAPPVQPPQVATPPPSPDVAPPVQPPQAATPPPPSPDVVPPVQPPQVATPPAPSTLLPPPPPPPPFPARPPPPPPPPPRVPPAPRLAPPLTVPPGLPFPPGFTIPPGVFPPPPPGASAALPGAAAGPWALLLALGLPALLMLA